MNDLKIIKKNGDLVDFNPDKIYEAVIAAGGSEEVAEKVKNYISEELPKIESSKIRELALEKLEKYDSEAYDSWIKYDLREKKAS